MAKGFALRNADYLAMRKIVGFIFADYTNVRNTVFLCSRENKFIIMCGISI